MCQNIVNVHKKSLFLDPIFNIVNTVTLLSFLFIILNYPTLRVNIFGIRPFVYWSFFVDILLIVIGFYPLYFIN